jgi:hypothetical protein
MWCRLFFALSKTPGVGSIKYFTLSPVARVDSSTNLVSCLTAPLWIGCSSGISRPCFVRRLHLIDGLYTIRLVYNQGVPRLPNRHCLNVPDETRATSSWSRSSSGQSLLLYLLYARPAGGVVGASQVSADSSTTTPTSSPPPMKSLAEKPRRLSAVLSSATVSTPFGFRDMARVHLPKPSTELLAVVSCLESVLTTVPYLSNSVLMASTHSQFL